MAENDKPQVDKFRDLARQLEADESEAAFEATVRKIATPRLAKVHSQQQADRLAGLGWTLKHEFRAEGDQEPYEYVLEWTKPGEPQR